MEDTFILEKRKRLVKIDDREFVLHEMGASEFRSYTAKLVELRNGLRDVKQLAPVGDVNELLQNTATLETTLLQLILSDAVEAEKTATDEFVANLSFAQRKQIFEIQDDLNDAADLLKNLMSLLA